jgi:hypothetical protein
MCSAIGSRQLARGSEDIRGFETRQLYVKFMIPLIPSLDR